MFCSTDRHRPCSIIQKLRWLADGSIARLSTPLTLSRGTNKALTEEEHGRSPTRNSPHILLNSMQVSAHSQPPEQARNLR